MSPRLSFFASSPLLACAIALAACSAQPKASPDNQNADPAATTDDPASNDQAANAPSATPDAPSKGSKGGSKGSSGSNGGSSSEGNTNPGGASGDPSLDAAADDPALASPTRPSAPFECQGDTIPATDVPALISQGYGGVTADSRTHSGWKTERGLGLSLVERTCTGATGCSAWHSVSTIVGFPESNRELVRIGLDVTAAGDVYVENPLWNVHGNYGSSTELRKLVTTVDTQLLVRLLNQSLTSGTDERARFRIRATRAAANGPVCVSAASTVSSYTDAQGVTTDEFWVGSVTLPVAARAQVPALDESPYQCAGAPSTNAEIAALFSPGQAQLNLQVSGTSTTKYFERYCHPVTGCTGYASSYRGWRLAAIDVDGAGFRIRLDNALSGPTFPITNGTFSWGVGDTGAVHGKCVDDRRLQQLSVDRYGTTHELLDLEKVQR